jgi:hypothetical protein
MKKVKKGVPNYVETGYRKKSRFRLRNVLLLLGIFMLLGMLCVFSGLDRGGTGSKSSPSVSTDVMIGEIGILHGSTGTHSVVFLTKEALDQFFKAKAANDDYGVNLILGSDLAFMVRNGTKVRVIDKGMFTRNIRILEGEMQGRAGVVATEWVTSQ